MPRTARKKSEDSIFHIMFRSISEIILFKEKEDKEKYFSLIKRYQFKLGFKVYAYCLMSNHGHLIIDANGADISKIMHSINQCYAQYLNRKYERHGHVFQDRFKSKIVKDDRYLLSLSAYIHNNPIDIKKYSACIQKYKYSSLGVYLGIRKDEYEILDEGYIMGLFSFDSKKAKELYLNFVNRCNNESIKDDIEFVDKNTEYRSERVILPRGYTPEEIVEFVVSYTKQDKRKIFIKYNREATKSKALCTFLMRRFCNFSHKEICKTIGNVTQARISRLCLVGYEMILQEEKYIDMIENFINRKAS